MTHLLSTAAGLPSARLRRRSLVAVPLVVVLTGCGSTALRGGHAVVGQAGLDAPAASVAGQDALPGDVDGGSSPSGSEVVAPVTPVAPAAGGGVRPVAGPTGAPPGGVVTPSGPPTTPTGPATSTAPVKVGILGVDLGAIAAVFGQDASDPMKTPKALVAALNAAGGIGGRPVEPVYYVADSGSDASTIEQKACTTFTQDHKVDVVLGGSSTGVLASCLLRAGIPMFDGNSIGPDAEQMAKYPNWFLPAGMRLDRSMAAVMQLGASRGVLTKGAKLGLLADSCASTDRIMKTTILPAAQRLGLSVTRGSFKCVENLVTDLVPVTASVQSETLRFSTAGVKAVMVVSSAEAFAIAQMSSVASQQHFFPTYLVSSNAYPFGNSQPDATIKINPDALPHMMGVGYLPLLDVGSAEQPDAKQAAARARCTKADPSQAGAASKEGAKKYLPQNAFFSACDTFFVMKATLEATGGRFGYQDVGRAYAKVLTSGLVSSVFVGGRYAGVASDRRDGAGMVQALTYDTSRKAFRYVGAPQPVR
jgi:hypothetical protein